MVARHGHTHRVPRPSDRICLVLPQPEGAPECRRWWYLEQPRPSVAFALQVRVAAALGGAADFALDAFLHHPDQVEDYEADRQTHGDDLAMRTLRRARSGKALFDPSEQVTCADRLWAVLRAAAARGGPRLDAALLAGEAEREPKTPNYRWPRASLLHRLLLDSGLRFDGTGPQPLEAPPVPPLPPNASVELQARAALRDAVAEGSVGQFVRALDDILASPDELGLLAAWAVLHLWRPF